jgi:stringent starvation protein B
VKEIPTKPYLLRALFEWCVDNGYTPYLGVKVDAQTQVPAEYVKQGQITLNISPSAVHKLQMGNELIEFSARFGGVARQISVPVANVYALRAHETGHTVRRD